MRAKFKYLLLYALICAAEFLLSKAKSAVEERLWPGDGDGDDS